MPDSVAMWPLPPDRGSRELPFQRHHSRGQASEAIERPVAIEHPIAFEFNGIGYAVMMATPADIEDFVVGFALSERLIDNARQLTDIAVHEAPTGLVVRATLEAVRAEKLSERARHRLSESSCGLCGIDSLEQAMRPLPDVVARSLAPKSAIFTALDGLRVMQKLNLSTGAVHAAALCSVDGTVLEVREDVGRHNAFDKLIGALARNGQGWGGGFALLSSRCSYELVEKAALANCPLLVTISAPTDLAVARATECGLQLMVLARPDALLEPDG